MIPSRIVIRFFYSCNATETMISHTPYVRSLAELLTEAFCESRIVMSVFVTCVCVERDGNNFSVRKLLWAG